MTEAGSYDVNSPCNADCGCPVSRMQPLCSKDGITNFYSPCHAGCRDVTEEYEETIDGKKTNKNRR